MDQVRKVGGGRGHVAKRWGEVRQRALLGFTGGVDGRRIGRTIIFDAK